ncbi:MAG: nuclear transport factor 2 family protein [Acidimicrobiia bacterium]
MGRVSGLMTPADLSRAFLDAYNRRDADTMRGLLGAEFSYVRPGPVTLEGVDRVMDRYAKDWEAVGATLRVRHLMEVGPEVVMEITIDRPDGVSIEAVVLHRWENEWLVRYRLYRDVID